jgi:hypothetical protein
LKSWLVTQNGTKLAPNKKAGSQYPTVRQCARTLRVSQATIHELLDHHNEEFDRLYWHTATPPKAGEWMVEYYGTSLLH